MGTRGLTAVMLDGEYKIAQYGQWDHYPSGQGIKVLEFCRKWLTSDKASQFLSNLATCRFRTKEDEKETQEWLKTIGSTDGWLTSDQAAQYKVRYPYLSRDVGAMILHLVADPLPGHELALTNNLDFAADSLFCEYAYIVDLDKGTLEVYKGFNKEALDPSERFAGMERSKMPNGQLSEYYPVKLLHSFELSNLPTNKVFLEILEPENEDLED